MLVVATNVTMGGSTIAGGFATSPAKDIHSGAERQAARAQTKEEAERQAKEEFEKVKLQAEIKERENGASQREHEMEVDHEKELAMIHKEAAAAGNKESAMESTSAHTTLLTTHTARSVRRAESSIGAMDSKEFRLQVKEVVDYVTGYHNNIRQRRPLPNVEPGYMKALIPETAPDDPETWEDVFGDIERVIMPGLTHWQSPHFHAYYPAAQSYPSICGNILSESLGSIGFNWMACPASTELEVIVMDWLGKMLQLPREFLSGGKGGGIIQSSGSECTLITLLTARNRKLSQKNANITASVEGNVSSGVDGEVFSRLVAYSSDQVHLSMQKACIFGAVRFHKVESNDKEEMTGPALAKAIASDVKKGLIPFYCAATLGTAATCAFDDLKQIGTVCKKAGVWLHVDAAYAGASFICPEFRPLLDGVEVKC
ncbi:Tyrosine decarboxylase [Lamellibrachia satsuma]|nr:Tyrosine decarboxylase [Lamellibrachia satsuma]